MHRLVCITAVAALLGAPAPADDWPQWRGPKRDGIWRETGIATRLPAGALAHVWRTPIGPGYAGPAVAGGRVFVLDRQKSEHTERVLCLDAKTGAVLWTHAYPCRYRDISFDSGPRCTPTVAGGKVYTVGTMGDLHCLETETGKVRWAKDYVEDFGARVQVWGVAAAPLVDGERVIAVTGGSGGAMVVAFHKDTGAELWRALPEQHPGYSTPILIETGGARQLVVWLTAEAAGLDPATGAVLWRREFPCKDPIVSTPLFAEDKLLLSAFYNGSRMFRMEGGAPVPLWAGKSSSEMEAETDGLHALMCPPMMAGGHVYGVCSYGALRCLDAETGARVWETHAATGQGRWWNAFLVMHGERTFIVNEQGELIIAKLTAQGYEELSRAQLLAPTSKVLSRTVVWSHPAFAYRHVFARNDREIVCASLAEDGGPMRVE